MRKPKVPRAAEAAPLKASVCCSGNNARDLF
jgi:hypothetical protein